MMVTLKAVSLSAAAMIAATAARSSTLSVTIDSAGRNFIFVHGTIAPGDSVRLRQMIADHRVSAFYFDSNGGNAMEGMTMAEAIHGLGEMVVVPNDGTCTLACFLMFAAGRDKFVGGGATIAVHSAGDENHKENLSAGAVTFVMARAAKSYAVPEDIIGRMVSTPSSSMATLSESDLARMGAKITNAPAMALKIVRVADPAPVDAPVATPSAVTIAERMQIAPQPAQPAAPAQPAPATGPGPSVQYAPPPALQSVPAAQPAPALPMPAMQQTKPLVLLCELDVADLDQTISDLFVETGDKLIEQNAMVADGWTSAVLSSRAANRPWSLSGDNVRATLRDDQRPAISIQIDIGSNQAAMLIGARVHAEGQCAVQ
jgi:hypothetical protein